MTEEEISDKEQLEYNNVMNDYFVYKKIHDRKRALKALFEKNSIAYEITDFNYLIRVFCWVKTLICLLFNKTNGSYIDNNKFCILAYDESTSYESQSWEGCWVSPYFFKDWNVCLASDGT